jgi:hypothetical protein
MAVSVPTSNQVVSTAKTGGVNGTAVALGETVGRGVLGPGLGTAAGGIVAASSLDGNARDMAATVAVERGMSELFAGAMGGGGGGGGVK